MKSLYVACAVCALLFFSANAQKVDLDRAYIKFRYRTLAEKPLDPSFRTYSIDASLVPTASRLFTKESIAQNLVLHGWKRLDEGRGHLNVNVVVDELIFNSTEITQRVDIQKNKDGKETGRNYYYRINITYEFDASASVKSHTNSVVYSKTFGGENDRHQWVSDEFDSRYVANEYLQNNLQSIRSGLFKERITETLLTIGKDLTRLYGYQAVNYDELFWVVGSKKHPEFEVQQAKLNELKEAMAKINANALPEDAKTSIENILTYFDDITSTYAGDDKGSRKLRYAAYYNRANLYLILDQPDLAKTEAARLIANDYDEKDGERFMKQSDELKKLFEVNNTLTRHFPIDVNAFKSPEIAQVD